MPAVTSKDGSTISFTRAGSGPPVILVDGALCWRASGPSEPLARLLARRFTVYTWDRRGRGDSGNSLPWAPEREIEDIAALIREAGGSACVYGISSGAALALHAARAGLAIRRLAIYEAPFIVDASRRAVPADYMARLARLLEEDRRGAAVKLFMREAVGLPGILVAMFGLMPGWGKLKSVAHTLPYDAAILGDAVDGKPLGAQWGVDVPTLVVSGTKSPKWIQNSNRQLATLIAGARFRALEGQTHLVKPAALAPLLEEFFSE